jgi:hypothetical protein
MFKLIYGLCKKYNNLQINVTHIMNTVIVLVNQLVSTFFTFSFEGEGVDQSESYVNLVFCETSNF